MSPAGAPEAAWAALAYGADAVYAGLSRFSARAEAGNFSAEELDELIGYAHHLDRRVFITFNTLVQQCELDEALETLALIRNLNADAVIVQDLGIARLIRKNFPQIRLHASTQLAVHNLEGTRQLAAQGFKRVVLARELSLKDIAHISRNSGIETEIFIHGALCYSYSGLCLFSSHLVGRSGNRGRCAYCCRQPFSSDGHESLPFSMKDFTAAEHLSELIDAGVAALKIEGRMKSPSYVAAVTDYYRRLADGTLSAPEQTGLLSDIQTIFGRPSTDLYLDDPQTDPIEPVNAGHHGALIGTVKEIRPGGWLIFHTNRALQKYDGLKVETPGSTFAYGFAAHDLRLASDPDSKRRFELPGNEMIAIRLPPAAPKIPPGTPIYCSISQAVRQRYASKAPRPGVYRQRRPVNIQVFQTLEKMELTASADGLQSKFILPGPFESARQPEKAAAAIQKCFEKLGETAWKLDQLTLEGDPVFVPISILNDARRRLIDDLSSDVSMAHHVPNIGKFTTDPILETEFWSVKSRTFQRLENIDEFVLEVDPARPEEIEKALAFYADKLRLALPVMIRDEDVDLFRELVERFSNGSPDSPHVVWKWEAANVGGLNLLQGKPDVTADWPLYTLNTQAALEWNAQGVQQFVLSPEDDADNFYLLIEQLGGAAVIPVYQHTPLMISATKPAGSADVLMDRARRNYRIEEAGREFVMVNETPFSLTDHSGAFKAHGARRFRIDLCYGIDSPEEAADLVRRIISGFSAPGHDGNFSRGLQ